MVAAATWPPETDETPLSPCENALNSSHEDSFKHAAAMNRRAKLISLIVYLLVVLAVVLGMTRVRSWARTTYGTVAAQEDWDTWREEAARQSGNDGAVEGPVKRRTPRSAKPPALVLMDDYFWVCLGFALLLSSVLYGTLVFMLVGATRKSVR